MEQNFQTSFMPKKPMIEERVSSAPPIGIIAVIAIFIFFAVLLSSGGLYFYRGIVKKNISSMETDLELAKSRFEPSKILQLQVLDKRLRASTDVLNRHIAITPIFKMLEDVTMKTVRYTKFTYDIEDGPNTKISFKINGQAIGYKSIALQSDLFTQNNQILDPVFSNLTLDDKGSVVFELTFSVDPSFVDYTKMIKGDAVEVAPKNVTPVEPTPEPILEGDIDNKTN